KSVRPGCESMDVLSAIEGGHLDKKEFLHIVLGRHRNGFAMRVRGCRPRDRSSCRYRKPRRVRWRGAGPQDRKRWSDFACCLTGEQGEGSCVLHDPCTCERPDVLFENRSRTNCDGGMM